MNIGNNIKKLRRGKDMTQEDLAEFLNISPQAVSRWETNLSMPDITMLPSLANLFGISVDELLGMDDLRNQALLADIYRQEQAYIANHEYAKAAEILRNAIKIFPGTYGLLSELAIALSFGDISTQEGIDAANEAIILCERVLANSTSEKLRGTTRATLCYLYKITGANKKAVEFGSTFPHIWESREMILPEVLEKPESEHYLKKAIQIVLVILSEKIDAVENDKMDMKRIAMGHGEIPDTLIDKIKIFDKITDFMDRSQRLE